jgi:hypothetical protein
MSLLQYIPRPVRIRLRALFLAAKCWKTTRELRELNKRYLVACVTVPRGKSEGR